MRHVGGLGHKKANGIARSGPLTAFWEIRKTVAVAVAASTAFDEYAAMAVVVASMTATAAVPMSKTAAA